MVQLVSCPPPPLPYLPSVPGRLENSSTLLLVFSPTLLHRRVPELLNVATPDSPDSLASSLHTALHELVHVFGGVGPAFISSQSPFIDDVGAQVPMSSVYRVGTDAAYGDKPMTFIVTPRVRNITRAAFGCATLPGFPLEDVELGAGVHWEARLAGPELMSYGTGSGLTFVSDLTLAFLEDTNQYLVNYSMAGPLVSSTATDYIVEPLSYLVPQNLGPPNSTSPGALTWGRGEGCAFVYGASRTWPAGYTCSEQNAYGCTPDHSMSAACVIKSTYTSEPACASLGGFAENGPTCGLNNDGSCNGAGCPITSALRFFSSDSAAATASGVSTATAATTGGFSAAMDYTPVYVGYWSCRDVTAQTAVTSSSEASSVSLSSLSSAFSSSGVSTIGGQSRGPTSRCLPSSLQALAYASTITYGLCYTTNCFRQDYLQVGCKAVRSAQKTTCALRAVLSAVFAGRRERRPRRKHNLLVQVPVGRLAPYSWFCGCDFVPQHGQVVLDGDDYGYPIH
jgi:hypothetical protein